MTQVKKLSTIVKKLKEFDELKSDGTYPTGELRFDSETCQIVAPADLFAAKVGYDMTDWALGQACGRLGNIPVAYMKRCPPDLRATNLNHWLGKMPEDRELFLRFYGPECRAILSKQYLPVANSDVAEGLLDIMGDGYDIVRPYFDPHTIHLKFRTMSDPNDDNFGYGVYVGNGEIGNRALTVAGFIQRNSCANSIIITGENWRLVHRGHRTLKEVMVMVKFWAGEALKLTIEQRDKIAEAAEKEIDDFSSVVEQLCKKNGLTNEVKDKVLMGSEGSSTLFGLVNGLSWAAHEQEDPELAIDLETMAGDVLLGRKKLQKVPAMALATYERQTHEEEV